VTTVLAREYHARDKFHALGIALANRLITLQQTNELHFQCEIVVLVMQHEVATPSQTSCGDALSKLAVNVPSELHRAAKSRAALRGQTLAEFVADAVRHAVGDK